VDVASWLIETRALIDRWIQEDFPPDACSGGTVEEVMRYSLLAGGKRLRPQLVLASAAYLGHALEEFKEIALAVEYLHTYSLIHDDLPAMDNDDWRRGSPTAHKQFGEAMAILGGDALLTEAFVKMTAPVLAARFDPSRLVAAIGNFSHAVGRHGLIQGQVKDLAGEGQALQLKQLAEIHHKKTGALIIACVQMPAMVVGDFVSEARLIEYGSHFGLAFQIVDDILNETGDAAMMGKSTGTDRALGKATYPALLGMEESRRLTEYHRIQAKTALGWEPRAELLQGLIDFAIDRQW
jgi:geranylgeranyl pyrophosphate synthase